MGYQLVVSTQSLLTAKGEIDNKRSAYERAEADYQIEVERKNELGYDVELIQSSMDVYDTIDKKSLQPLPLILRISEGLGNTVKLDGFRITEKIVAKPRNGAEEEKMLHQAVLLFSFKADLDPEVAVERVNALRDRLARLFPDLDVEITKQAYNLDTSTSFIGETKDFVAEDVKKADETAEITISGAML